MIPAPVFWLTTCLVLGTLQAADLVFEETFNQSSEASELINGAVLSPDAEGVSGRPGDTSYTSNNIEGMLGSSGPAAKLSINDSMEGVEEFTFTIWYQSRVPQGPTASLFEGCGLYLIWEKQNYWTLRVESSVKEDPKKFYWFSLDGKAPMRWGSSGQWIFMAAVWNRSKSELTIYQGSPENPAMQVKQMQIAGTASPIKDLQPKRRTIGNNGSPYQRYFDGKIDNVRLYRKALSSDAIEKIRQADSKNETPVP